jgi:hypothetical protein
LLLLDAAVGPDDGRVLDSLGIVDIGNLIRKCVVSGNIRRTDGSPSNEAFLVWALQASPRAQKEVFC